jgi:hypothetical protein
MDERAHENFAELGVPSDKRPQAFTGNFQKFTRLGDAAKNQAVPAGDHGHFSGKSARAVRGDGTLAGKIRLNNFHAAGKEDKKGNMGIARLEEYFAGANRADLSDGPDAADLGGRKGGESLGFGIESAGDYG